MSSLIGPIRKSANQFVVKFQSYLLKIHEINQNLESSIECQL